MVEAFLVGKHVIVCLYQGRRCGRHCVLKELALRAAHTLVRQATQHATVKLCTLHMALFECGLRASDMTFDIVGHQIIDPASLSGGSVLDRLRPLTNDTLSGLSSLLNARPLTPTECSGHYILHLEAEHANDVGALTVVSVASFEKLGERQPNNTLALQEYCDSLCRLQQPIGALAQRCGGHASNVPLSARGLILGAGALQSTLLVMSPPVSVPTSRHYALVANECHRLRNERGPRRPSKDDADDNVLMTSSRCFTERNCVLPSPPPSDRFSFSPADSLNSSPRADGRSNVENVTTPDSGSNRTAFTSAAAAAVASVGSAIRGLLPGRQAAAPAVERHTERPVSEDLTASPGSPSNLETREMRATLGHGGCDALTASSSALRDSPAIGASVGSLGQRVPSTPDLRWVPSVTPRQLLDLLASADSPFNTDEWQRRVRAEGQPPEDQVNELLGVIAKMQQVYHEVLGAARQLVVPDAVQRYEARTYAASPPLGGRAPGILVGQPGATTVAARVSAAMPPASYGSVGSPRWGPVQADRTRAPARQPSRIEHDAIHSESLTRSPSLPASANFPAGPMIGAVRRGGLQGDVSPFAPMRDASPVRSRSVAKPHAPSSAFSAPMLHGHQRSFLPYASGTSLQSAMPQTFPPPVQVPCGDDGVRSPLPAPPRPSQGAADRAPNSARTQGLTGRPPADVPQSRVPGIRWEDASPYRVRYNGPTPAPNPQGLGTGASVQSGQGSSSGALHASAGATPSGGPVLTAVASAGGRGGPTHWPGPPPKTTLPAPAPVPVGSASMAVQMPVRPQTVMRPQR